MFRIFRGDKELVFDDDITICSYLNIQNAECSITRLNKGIGSDYVVTRLLPRNVTIQGYFIKPTDMSTMKTLLTDICTPSESFTFDLDGRCIDLYLTKTINYDKNELENSEVICHFTINATALEPRWYYNVYRDGEYLKVNSVAHPEGEEIAIVTSDNVTMTGTISGLYYPTISVSTITGETYNVLEINKAVHPVTTFKLDINQPLSAEHPKFDINMYEGTFTTKSATSTFLDPDSEYFSLGPEDVLEVILNEDSVVYTSTLGGKLYLSDEV